MLSNQQDLQSTPETCKVYPDSTVGMNCFEFVEEQASKWKNAGDFVQAYYWINEAYFRLGCKYQTLYLIGLT